MILIDIVESSILRSLPILEGRKRSTTPHLLLDDSLGHITKKEVIIFVIDMQNEPAPIVVVNSNEPLQTDNKTGYFITIGEQI